MWETFTDISTDGHAGRGALPYDEVVPGDAARFAERVAREAGLGVFGRVGGADCWLVEAAEFTTFAVSWLTTHFR